MEERIMEILKTLVSMKSVSCSTVEQEPAEWFAGFFKAMPYFEKHPEDTGLYEIPDDPYGRKIPYALIRGKKKDTVLLSGHFDVVSTEEYGKAEPWAYEVGSKLEGLLEDMFEKDGDTESMEALKSGEWLWGRGVADMKGGLSLHAALFEEYAKKAESEELEGSILFMPVPDEESYSAGMRNGINILRMFQDKYDLNYKLLIDPEPTACKNGTQIMSIGTVGKVMPAIIVQGKKGHAGHCYEGFSALNIMSDIYLRTNGSLEFSEVYEDEASVPPTWANMRDMKPGYDVSIPHRAYGYFTALNFGMTPEEILNKLRRICTEAFETQVEKLNGEYQQYKTMNKAEVMDKIYYEPCVKTFVELCDELRKTHGEEFDKFYSDARAKAVARVNSGESNFPSATVEMMEAVLDYSGIQYPLVLLGFAPPYYPPTHSNLVKGKEGYGTKAYEFAKKMSEDDFGQKLGYENFFMGISDLSYSAITSPFDYEKYSDNTPLWGDSYNMDFEAMEKIAIPGIIYGPIGVNYHQYSERVNKESLLKVMPETTKALIEYMWTL